MADAPAARPRLDLEREVLRSEGVVQRYGVVYLMVDASLLGWGAVTTWPRCKKTPVKV